MGGGSILHSPPPPYSTTCYSDIGEAIAWILNSLLNIEANLDSHTVVSDFWTHSMTRQIIQFKTNIFVFKSF